jgi:hypothetical protein
MGSVTALRDRQLPASSSHSMRLRKWGRFSLSSDTRDLVSALLGGLDRIYLPGYCDL